MKGSPAGPGGSRRRLTSNSDFSKKYATTAAVVTRTFSQEKTNRRLASIFMFLSCLLVKCLCFCYEAIAVWQSLYYLSHSGFALTARWPGFIMVVLVQQSKQQFKSTRQSMRLCVWLLVVVTHSVWETRQSSVWDYKQIVSGNGRESQSVCGFDCLCWRLFLCLTVKQMNHVRKSTAEHAWTSS